MLIIRKIKLHILKCGLIDLKKVYYLMSFQKSRRVFRSISEQKVLANEHRLFTVRTTFAQSGGVKLFTRVRELSSIYFAHMH